MILIDYANRFGNHLISRSRRLRVSKKVKARLKFPGMEFLSVFGLCFAGEARGSGAPVRAKLKLDFLEALPLTVNDSFFENRIRQRELDFKRALFLPLRRNRLARNHRLFTS